MKKLLKQLITVVITTTILLNNSSIAYALDGVYHEPTGNDELYGGKEVASDPCERYPRDPMVGENVYIKIKTWPIEPGDAVWVTWKKNNVDQPVVNAQWKYNSGNDTHWEANLGSFSKGDLIEYWVHANQNGANQKTIGSYSFIVTEWDYVKNVTSVVSHNNRVELKCSSEGGTLLPKISFSFPGEGYFRMQFEPLGNGTFSGGLTNYTVDNSNPAYTWIYGPGIRLKINKTPYQLEVYDGNGVLLTKESDRINSRSLLEFP